MKVDVYLSHQSGKIVLFPKGGPSGRVLSEAHYQSLGELDLPIEKPEKWVEDTRTAVLSSNKEQPNVLFCDRVIPPDAQDIRVTFKTQDPQ